MTATQFAALLDAHGAALLLYARQWCGCPEDVVQDAFLKLCGLNHPPDDPAAWLFRAVRNGAIDAARTGANRRRREGAVARPEGWFEDDDSGLDADLAVAALRELPFELREVIVAHLWGGQRFDQIAAIVGCSASTAHRRYSVGLRELRQRLGASCPSETK